MIISFENAGRTWRCDLSRGQSIAMDLDFNSENQPNLFGAPRAKSQPLSVGEFTGKVSEGGSCNVDQISLTPHCNGTHTETVGHIVTDGAPVATVLPQTLIAATVVSVKPIAAAETQETYQPAPKPTDQVITAEAIDAVFAVIQNFSADALIVRTGPIKDSKLTHDDDMEGSTPFFTNDAMKVIVDRGFKHLLVDFPSVDRLDDDGLLSNHRIFWDVEQGSTKVNANSRVEQTITELTQVPADIQEGPCLLSIQIPAFLSDAAPSRPIIYPIQLA